MLHDFKTKLSDAFSINERGIKTWIWGCKVEQSRGRISLSQRLYMKDVLSKSHMSDCKPVSTPARPRSKQSKLFLCFLKGTESLCPVYNRSEYLELFDFLDSDWATDKNERKSTSIFASS